MKKNPKISIITCTYNRFHKLLKNINSVKKQKYKNYEHFIIDDGSTDKTFEYFSKNKDKKINYLRLVDNSGQPTALFKSNVFKKLKGDYIIILDSDDYLLKNAFKTFLAYRNKFGEKFWNFAFDFTEKNKKNHKQKNNYTITDSKDCFSNNHPRNIDNAGYRDFLNIRKKIFYKKLVKYFVSPDYWYSSQFEVSLNNTFKEIYIYNKIYFMSFDTDSITRGFNIKKYRKHVLKSRERLFAKYNEFMDKNFFIYTLKSLVMNYLVNKEYKNKIFNIISENKIFFLKNILFSICILLLFILPSDFLLFIKSKIKQLRLKRY